MLSTNDVYDSAKLKLWRCLVIDVTMRNNIPKYLKSEKEAPFLYWLAKRHSEQIAIDSKKMKQKWKDTEDLSKYLR